nr:ammonia-forming cytochrome c nitrite reductase subunit c552 [Microthrixaceae bacterium]
MTRTYDAVIIGAGHNGLTLGAYLARSGLDVVVLERRHEEGGGLCTEEVTRPGFLLGIAELAKSDAPVPAMPTVELWRKGERKTPYDPNQDATRNEMRSFVCGQCHVEYYCSSKMPLTFPWGKGLAAEQVEAYWDDTKFADGSTFM